MNDHEVNGRLRVDLLVRNGYVVTVDRDRRIIKNASIAVSNGNIVAVGKSADIDESYEATRYIDASEAIVIPGLVDAHVHAGAEHVARSAVPDDTRETWLTEWAVPLYAAMTPDEEFVGAQLACYEMMLNGTTTFCEGGSVVHMDAVYSAVSASGMRATLGPWLWDQVEVPERFKRSTQQALRHIEATFDRFHQKDGSLVRIAASCVNPAVCSEELLRGLFMIAQEHESVFEFHHGSRWEPVVEFERKTGKRPIEALDAIGVIGRQTHAAHMVHLDDNEIAILAEKGASVAYCPQAALRCGYGLSRRGRMPELQRAGVDVALGSDGVNSSDNQDLFKVMQIAAGLFKDARENTSIFPAESVLEMATIRGARALGLEDVTGSLEVGKSADIVLLDRRCPELTPLIDVANAIVYGCDGRRVRTVICRGNVLVEGGRVQVGDLDEALDTAEKVGDSLFRRAGLKPSGRWPVS